MRDSSSPKTSRALRIVKSFVLNPKQVTYDLTRYLFRKLPSHAQDRLESPARKLIQKLRRLQSSVSHKPKDLFSDIANRFHVPEKFVRLYREQGYGSIDWAWPNWPDFLENLPPLQKLSVPFAMSTVMRGQSMFLLLKSQSCIRKKNRYLDVGTGYGGFLRAAKKMGFKEVIGIELQPQLVQLARANIDELQGAQVLIGDFVKEDFSSLGYFDLITCNDVIEHVDDPALAIQKMSSLANQDGCISFEVPNKDAIEFVKSDGHFLIFGITQLAKNEAAAYYSAYTGADKSEYDFEMGEMYELDWYFGKLKENGWSAFIADTHSMGGIEDVPDQLADLKKAYQQWQEVTKPRLNADIAQHVTTSIDRYIRDLEQDFIRLGDNSSRGKFKDKYLRSFWTIIATKGHPV